MNTTSEDVGLEVEVWLGKAFCRCEGCERWVTDYIVDRPPNLSDGGHEAIVWCRTCIEEARGE